MKLNAFGVLFAVIAAAIIPHGKAIGIGSFGMRNFGFNGLEEPVGTRSTKAVTYGYVTQPLDHFNPRDNRTWSMRYFASADFYKSSSDPILIMLGGESAISAAWLTSGQMYNIASTHGALMFYTEHRYYGESRPTSDMSPENLQYLNADQALADVAYFIETVKTELNMENSTVVVFGGSYAGNMAAWARIKYPHLIKGAVASSAPVFAKADFFEYMEVVAEALTRYNPQCPASVKEAMLAAEDLIQTSTGRQTLKRYFNLCSDIDGSSSQDVASFMSSLSGVFSGIVQYNWANSAGESDITRVCDVMTSTYLGSPLQRLAYYVSGSTNCLDLSYQGLLDDFGEEEWSSSISGMMRQWYYQTCTEYGYYQSSSSNSSIFGTLVPVEYFTQICKDLYGDYYDENLVDASVKRTNIVYGGITPDVTNVIFVNGDLDPWHALSVLEDLNESSPAIVVPGSSHCLDMYGYRYADSVEMVAAKARVRQIVGEWLS